MGPRRETVRPSQRLGYDRHRLQQGHARQGQGRAQVPLGFGLESERRRFIRSVVAKLTIDAKGKNGLDPGFDRQNVLQYGLLLDGQSDGLGHTEWANFAASLGWNYCDGPWATHFNYDDPKLIDTIRWFADLSLRKGFIVPAKDARQAPASGLFAAQKGALALTGSWLVHWYAENCKFDIGFAPLPKGPVGRKSVINGLGGFNLDRQ